MLILRRLSIWLLETSLEALLLGVVLVSLSGDNPQDYDCLAIHFRKTTFPAKVQTNTMHPPAMFFSTGFLFTTGIIRAVWRGRSVWLYPLVALMLFFIHFEILNYAAGGVFDPPKRTVIRI